MELEDVLVGGVERAPGNAAVGASERVPVGREDVLGAAKGGHLEVLQWARQNGCPWDNNAAREGHLLVRGTRAGTRHLEVLQWARQNGCPWDVRSCIYSAQNRGHLDVLQWLRENV